MVVVEVAEVEVEVEVKTVEAEVEAVESGVRCCCALLLRFVIDLLEELETLYQWDNCENQLFLAAQKINLSLHVFYCIPIMNHSCLLIPPCKNDYTD